MITEDIKIEKKEKMEYPPIPKNIYQVEIFDISMADAKGHYSKPGEKVFVFQFTLLEGKDKDRDLRGRNIWNNFVPTFLYIGKNGKNDLFRIIEAVLGRELEPEEEAAFDKDFLNSLIGKQIRIMIEPKKVGDRIYDNVTDYLFASSQLPKLTEEEKEKAKVKKKKEDDETPADMPEEEEVKIEDVPF